MNQASVFTRKLLIVSLAAGLLTTAVLTSHAQTGAEFNPHSSDPIDLAIVGPMVGTSFSVGMQFSAGTKAAIATLPEGMLMGRPIRITEYDDNCVKLIAEKLSLDLAQTPPDVVIGHSCSATTLVSAPIYARHGILQITPASTAPQVTEIGISSIFRMIGRDDLQGRMAAEWLATHHRDDKIGIFGFENSYSAGLTGIAIDELAKRGMELTLLEQGSASATSYLSEIMSFVAAEVDVVYVVGGALDSGVFVRQANLVAAPFRIIGTDTMVSSIFRETAGEAADGIPFTFPADAIAFIDEPQTRAAMDAIKQQGMAPEGYTLLAYAATQVWVEGVRRAESLESDAVAAAIRQAPLQTVLGTVSFDAKGDIQTTYAPFSWFMWQDGQRVPLQ